MIVADTSAMIALIDADDRHHHQFVQLYEANAHQWVLPWAILPEVDYLLSRRVGERAAQAFRADLASRAFEVQWGAPEDLERAHQLCTSYASLELGLVDACVAAVAEKLGATAIATLDLRDFGALQLARSIRILPRDG